jgi:hypothetical protein
MDPISEASDGNIAKLPIKLHGQTTMPPGKAFNILISQAVTMRANVIAQSLASSQQPKEPSNVFRLRSNKFYNSKSRIVFDQYSIITYSDFFSTLKFGMGSPLFNANKCTTAFFSAIPVSDLMHRFVAKKVEDSFKKNDKRALKTALKGCRVTINFKAE